MAKQQKAHPIVDVDSHVLEPWEIWTQYVEPEYRVAARSAFSYRLDDAAGDTVILNGKMAAPLRRGKLNRLALYKPGMTAKEIGSLDPSKPQPATAGASAPKARLKDMDAMGIDQSIVFPTLFLEYLPTVENPELADALARAYNNWARDFAQAAPDRLFPAAVLPMQSPSMAVAELRRVAGIGFKAVAIRPAFFRDRLPHHRDYDPLWAELERSGVAACMHPSSGVTNAEWTSHTQFIERVAANLRIGQPASEPIAPAMDSGMFLSALCFFGHMETFPKLKLGYLHSGAYWVPLALEKSETYLWLTPQAKPVSLEPEEVFQNRPSLVSFDSWESCVRRLVDEYEKVAAWGSRYPHHDATAPAEAIKNLGEGGVPGDVIRRYMGGNAAQFFGLKTPVAA